ncbi:hypothetical protein FIBSPDRAFT_950538 [Athelia psychrophila]|uniref:Uncharacterized protein n=1 Tax=Athelia psychrophila TaxID=1759441 RepID=A0A166NMA7_9AGAM|nr:hypothetical protein FIBSPDRAFT_950538 [Fibularhizoctonia sp. CBS 109695]
MATLISTFTYLGSYYADANPSLCRQNIFIGGTPPPSPSWTSRSSASSTKPSHSQQWPTALRPSHIQAGISFIEAVKKRKKVLPSFGHRAYKTVHFVNLGHNTQCELDIAHWQSDPRLCKCSPRAAAKTAMAPSALSSDWDIWGPLILCVMLATMLSANGPSSSVHLSLSLMPHDTHGHLQRTPSRSFFRGLCVLGYCIAPLDIAAFIVCFVRIMCARACRNDRLGVVYLEVVTVYLLDGTKIEQQRILLAVYPLLYA